MSVYKCISVYWGPISTWHKLLISNVFARIFSIKRWIAAYDEIFWTVFFEALAHAVISFFVVVCGHVRGIDDRQAPMD